MAVNQESKKIVVIGGSGFIGTRLVARLLNEGHQVTIADTEDSRAYPALRKKCDVRNLDEVCEACEGQQIIYNLAAVHRDDVRPLSLYADVNVGGARNICQAAAKVGAATIIFTSSVAIYGLPKLELDETAPPNPFNEYGKTKFAAEDVHREWQSASADRSIIIVRPTVVFGSGNRGNVYNLLKQIASGIFVMVGSGKNQKSMAYVENLAAFLEFVLQFGAGEHIYNYVDKPDFDMNTLVGTVKSLLGRDPKTGIRLPYALAYSMGLLADGAALVVRRNLPISAVRVRKFCSNSQFSVTKARGTGFTPPVNLHDALRDVVRTEFGK